MSSLKELVRQDLVIPAVPMVASRLIACLNDPDVDVDEVVAAIEADPGLVAALLKHANSAAFGLARQLATASEAVRFLGMDKVRGMAIAAAVRQSCSTVPEDKVAMVWLLSQHTAQAAACYARVLRQPIGLASTGGMLHAVGMLAMHACMPAAISSLDAVVEPWHLDRCRAERREIGFDYADAGAMLLRAWNLPQALVEALAWQHEPLLDGDFDMLACILHLASWRVRAELADLSRPNVAETAPHAVADRIGLDRALLTGDIPGREALEPMSAETA